MKTYYQYFHFVSCTDSIVKSLQEHMNQQSSERKKLYKHRKKFYDAPDKYMSMIIDGMDQKKKHFCHIFSVHQKIYRKRISFSFTWLVVCFLMEQCIQGFTSQLQIFIMMQIVTITIIHHVLTHWSGNLPQVLYM
jgi:hypothetical protein